MSEHPHKAILEQWFEDCNQQIWFWDHIDGWTRVSASRVFDRSVFGPYSGKNNHRLHVGARPTWLPEGDLK